MDHVKKRAASRMILEIEQMRYYHELTPAQLAKCGDYWGIEPPRSNYVYAARRDGGLVWDRVRIAEVQLEFLTAAKTRL